jgi:hypothetical protein
LVGWKPSRHRAIDELEVAVANGAVHDTRQVGSVIFHAVIGAIPREMGARTPVVARAALPEHWSVAEMRCGDLEFSCYR